MEKSKALLRRMQDKKPDDGDKQLVTASGQTLEDFFDDVVLKRKIEQERRLRSKTGLKRF